MNIYTSSPDDKSIAASVIRLQYLVDTIPPLLQELPEKSFSQIPAPDKWSKKEILGHLIDSATNNHQRFIRIRFDDKPVIHYHQEQWVSSSDYNSYDKDQLIDFWKLYNKHLIHIIKRIPFEDLSKTGIVKEATEEMPLYFYINDYVAHTEHHLKQIVSY